MSSSVENPWKGMGELLKKSFIAVGNSPFIHTTLLVVLRYAQQLRFLCTTHFDTFFNHFTGVNYQLVHTFHRAYKYNYTYIQYN